MKMLEKNRTGFSLVELIVVIAILALLAVAAVLAFNGVQQNARRSQLHSDASALAAALNNHNAQALPADRIVIDGALNLTDLEDAGAEIPDPGTSITTTVPARGVQAETNHFVDFETSTHRERAVNALDGDENGHFRVDTARVREPEPDW